jgi:hypothetical protein
MAAYFPAVRSSMTDDEILTLMRETYDRHKMDNDLLIDFQRRLTHLFAERLVCVLSNEWVGRLNHIDAAIDVVTETIARITGGTQLTQLCSFLVGFALSIKTGANLMLFSNRMSDVLARFNETLGLNREQIATAVLFGEMAFQFWLVVEQLETMPETKELSKPAFNSSVIECSGTNWLASHIAFMFAKHRLESRFKVVCSDELVSIRVPAEGASELNDLSIYRLRNNTEDE